MENVYCKYTIMFKRTTVDRGIMFHNFFNRLKFQNLKRYEEFWITFSITYLITILFTIFICINNFEERILDANYTESVWSFLLSSTGGFNFGYCYDISAMNYLFAKIIETLIPTTVTFAGTILILQSVKVRYTSLNAMLFIALTILLMAGVFFMFSRLESTLVLYMKCICIIFAVIIIFSAKLYYIQDADCNFHKREVSDGIMIG